MSKNINIIFYCHWDIKKKGDIYFIPNVHNLYLNTALKSFKRVTLISKVEIVDEIDTSAFKKINDVEILELPSFNGYLKSSKIFFQLLKYAKKIGSYKNNNLIYIRSPEPFSWLFYLFNKNKFNKLLYHFASNPIEAIINKRSHSKLKRILFIMAFLPELALIGFSARQNITSVNGVILKNKLKWLLGKHPLVIDESTLQEKLFIDNLNILSPYPFKNKSIKILYVGYLRPAKGVSDLINALHLLKNNGFDVSLKIVGHGEQMPELQDLSIKLGLSDSIDFIGEIGFGPELFKIYKSSDLFVLPSMTEGSPRVILEAMAFKLPIISTNVGNIPFLLSNKRGLLIEPGNTSMLVNEIEKLITSKVELIDVHGAFDFAKDRTIEAFMNKLKEVIVFYEK